MGLTPSPHSLCWDLTLAGTLRLFIVCFMCVVNTGADYVDTAKFMASGIDTIVEQPIRLAIVQRIVAGEAGALLTPASFFDPS